ncbi:MAG: type IV secretion protein DotH [Alphaproteobacteria bacterium]|nr:type IV secretion protein DotH [Alphaproteobacteria bacterium]
MTIPPTPQNLDRILKNRFGGPQDYKALSGRYAGLNDGALGGVKMGITRLLGGALLAYVLILGAGPAFAQQQVDKAANATAAVVTTTTTTTATPPAAGVQETAAATAEPAALPTLPASNDAPPVEPADPLAAFKQAAGANAQPADPANNAPVPTPGGFQQPADGLAADQNVELPLSDEDLAAKEADLQQKAREQAFDSALNGLMPMSPDQIRAMLDKYRVTRDASESRIGGTPRPEITVQTVSLEPGVTPPVIKLSPGHVTSVTMMDVTGEPWPVQDVSWGGNFEIISPEDGGHIIRISPMGATEVGNMSVQLVGLKTPVTFTLETQLEVVQYRFDARIPEYGPKAAPPIIDPGSTDVQAGTDKAIGQILDGVPPAGTEKVRLAGVDARTSVFRIGPSTYLRTPLTLLSPGWSASAKSADGMTVYVVNDTPVFLLSDRGRMVRAVVENNKAEP